MITTALERATGDEAVRIADIHYESYVAALEEEFNE